MQGWPLPASTEVWVLTTTSGAAPMTVAQRTAPYQRLAERLALVPLRAAGDAPSCRTAAVEVPSRRTAHGCLPAPG